MRGAWTRSVGGAGRRRAAHGAALAAALVLGVAGCASTLDGARLEQAIGADLAGAGLPAGTVQCPRDRPVRQGDTFTCRVTLADGTTLTYDVTQTSDGGEASYKPAPGQVVLGPDVEADLQQRVAQDTGSQVKVSCPRSVLTPGGKGTMACTVTSDKEAIGVDVQLEGGKVVTWTIKADTSSTTLPAG